MGLSKFTEATTIVILNGGVASPDRWRSDGASSSICVDEDGPRDVILGAHASEGDVDKLPP